MTPLIQDPDPPTVRITPKYLYREIRVCPRCQSEFRPSWKPQKFCSNYCSQKNRWERRIPFGPLPVLSPTSEAQ